jgi:hypothetical protein
MNRELLEQPFDREQIKQREGNFNRMLNFIEGHVVIQRLNDAFESAWSFEIMEHKILEAVDEVIVLGKFSAGEVVKMQFGSSRVTKARETGDMISLSDDFKAAATDSLKKCATMLGVGLHLYDNDKTNNGMKSNNGSNKSEGRGTFTNHKKNGGNGSNGNGNGNGRLSLKQLNYILSLSKDNGLTRSELKSKCLDTFGVVPEFLSKMDASTVIKELQAV